jgi:alkyl hydroperoxide reductase subunit AhpF
MKSSGKDQPSCPAATSREEGTMQLEIYITKQCANCEEALFIAEQARVIAGLDVAVIDLERTEQNIHPRVVAVPTYILNGQVVSLGNPERQEFLAQLRRLLEEVSR